MCRRAHLSSTAAVVALMLHAVSSRADRWETTRRAVIDPLNSEVHRHLPQYLKRRDLDAVLGLYTTEVGSGITWDEPVRAYPRFEEETLRWGGRPGEETIPARCGRPLPLFPTIDNAGGSIHPLDW